MCDVLDRVENRGRAEGRTEGGNFMIYSLVQDGDLIPEKGAARLQITVDELKRRMELCGYKFPGESKGL